MKNIRKYTTLSVLAVLLFPEALFAQGAVVAYTNPLSDNVNQNNVNNFPSNNQFIVLVHSRIVTRWFVMYGAYNND